MLKTDKDAGPGDTAETIKTRSEMTLPATFPLRLPKSMRLQANELARVEGISLNQFISIAVAEKLARMESSPALNRLLDETDIAKKHSHKK